MKSSILTIANLRKLMGKPNKHFLFFSYYPQFKQDGNP